MKYILPFLILVHLLGCDAPKTVAPTEQQPAPVKQPVTFHGKTVTNTFTVKVVGVYDG